MAAAEVQAESEYLDVDVVEEDSGALPLGASAQRVFDQEPELPLDFGDNTAVFSVDDLQEVDADTDADEAPERDADELVADETADDMTDEFEAVSEADPDHDYEYVDDSSGVEAAADSAPTPRDRSRRNAAGATSRRPRPP